MDALLILMGRGGRVCISNHKKLVAMRDGWARALQSAAQLGQGPFKNRSGAGQESEGGELERCDRASCQLVPNPWSKPRPTKPSPRPTA